MMPFSITYKGYTLTCIANAWRIAGMPYIIFLTETAAKRYIDKL